MGDKNVCVYPKTVWKPQAITNQFVTINRVNEHVNSEVHTPLPQFCSYINH